jgi:hypothetical protein
MFSQPGLLHTSGSGAAATNTLHSSSASLYSWLMSSAASCCELRALASLAVLLLLLLLLLLRPDACSAACQ